MINCDKIGVSIDEISYMKKNVFRLHLIPDFDSEYFIPAHMRYVNVYEELLAQPFLSWIKENHTYGDNMSDFVNGIGSAVQGGYYKIPKYIIFNNSNLATDTVFDKENDIFRENRQSSPYGDDIRGEMVGSESLNVKSTNDDNNTILYGFHVGQGDMLLLITAEKNAYIIDTNIYDNADLHTKIVNIKCILRRNNMDDRKIKALIITHKHADHIRGANNLINSNELDIEHLIMNLDYFHPTILVNRLLVSAYNNIPTWINLNNDCSISEGNTMICFRNPDSLTRLAPDINDSSIAMCIRYKENLIFLTGDASASILENCMSCTRLCNGIVSDSLLKVSHHGSRTGTSDSLLNILNSKKAYISVGYSKKYKHPHRETITALSTHSVDTAISRNIRRIIEYRCNGRTITKKII